MVDDMTEWQPIETAPKDDHPILCYHPHPGGGYRICTMLWHKPSSSWRADVHSFIRFDPTHWMPLPEPPK